MQIIEIDTSKILENTCLNLIEILAGKEENDKLSIVTHAYN